MFCQRWYGGPYSLHIILLQCMSLILLCLVINFAILIFVSIRFRKYYSVTTITAATWQSWQIGWQENNNTFRESKLSTIILPQNKINTMDWNQPTLQTIMWPFEPAEESLQNVCFKKGLLECWQWWKIISYIFDLRLHVITYLLFSFFLFSFRSFIALVFYF